MPLYVLCRIVDIISIVVLATDLISIITQQEAPSDIVATFVAVLWGTINSAQLGLGMLIVNLVILAWYGYRVVILIITHIACKEQSEITRPLLIVLLSAREGSPKQLTPIETEFLSSRTERVYDNVKVTFDISDLLLLASITCASEWNIAGLDSRSFTIASTKRKRSDGITKWIISTNIGYCGPSTPEIAIPLINRNIDSGSCLVCGGEHGYSVDLWDPNFMSIADLRSTDSQMLVTIIWTFIYLYDCVAELNGRFTHFQICSDADNRLCFVLWGERIPWYAVAQCRATICDLLNALNWHQIQARYLAQEAPESAPRA